MSPSTPSYSTRAFRELCAMMHKYGDVSAHTGLHGFIVLIVNDKENNTIFQFNVSSAYPFSPPKQITVNKTPYANTLRITNRFKPFLNTLYGLTCMCCDSLICSDKWAPCSTMQLFIDEYYTNVDRKQKCMECYFSQLLCKRNGCTFAYIDEYLTGKHHYIDEPKK